MATGIARKASSALFPLLSFGKNGMPKMKKKKLTKRKRRKHGKEF